MFRTKMLGTSVRARLVLLVLACLIPMIVFCTGLSLHFVHVQNDHLEEQVAESVFALSQNVDRYISEAQVALELLATSPALRAGDLEAFYAQIVEAAKIRGTGIVLLDTTGQQLASTNRSFGSPLPRRTELETLNRVVATARPQISDLITAAILKRPILSVEVPVLIDGRVRYVLAMGITPEAVSDIVHFQRRPDEWIAVVFDRKAITVGRSHDPETLVGQPASPSFLKVLEQAGNGDGYQMISRQGRPISVSYMRSPVTGWTSVIAVPQEVLEAPVLQQTALLTGLAVVTFALGVALAGSVARGITRPLLRLAEQATHSAPTFSRTSYGITEFNTLSSALATREEERDAAMADLRASEARFRHLADNAPVMVWVTEPDGRCSYLSRSWFEFTGQIAESGLGFGWLDAVHPEDRAHSEEIFRLANAQQSTFRVEYRLRRADGGYSWVIDTSTPWFADDGRFLGFIGSVLDITEMREIRATLEARVAEEVSVRLKAEEHLRQAQKMDAMGKLTGGVAHDFNNLLQALSGCLHMVEQRVQDPGVNELLAAGWQTIGRGAKLVQQLMAFARREAVQSRTLNLADQIIAMNDMMSQALRGRARLNLELAQGLWSVEVEPTQFEMAVVNLLVNARDAMPTGGHVTVRAENVRLPSDSPNGLSGNFVRLSVTDTGNGMPPDVFAHAFDPFFTTKEIGKGTGLGLAQVYGFARQAGGSAWIDSEEGKGTTVHILLPPSSATAQPTTERSIGDASCGRPGARILVVEDDPIIAITVSAALEDAGFVVQHVSTADEALPIVQAGDLDLLFSDVVMPGTMNGLDLAKEAQRLWPILPIILATGYSDDIASAAGLHVLNKPYRIDLLVGRVNALLVGSQTAERAAFNA
ncbi:ATP-binding protein [Azospirillum endophyticum]